MKNTMIIRVEEIQPICPILVERACIEAHAIFLHPKTGSFISHSPIEQGGVLT